MIITTEHLAVLKAALEFWDDEMSPHDPGVYTAYFQEPLESGEWVKEAVSFLRAGLPVCDLRYALLAESGLALAHPQLFATLEAALRGAAGTVRRIGTLLIRQDQG